MLVELRSTGTQTIFPPSRHPSGEEVRWEPTGEPVRVEPAELTKACATLAAATLLAANWPGRGTRQNAALALAGSLLRAGWSKDLAARPLYELQRELAEDHKRAMEIYERELEAWAMATLEARKNKELPPKKPEEPRRVEIYMTDTYSLPLALDDP